jgi:RNA polymerase sigma-70 factor (ECF subfamily)
MQTTAPTQLSQIEESQWIASARRGDLEAFNMLILRYQDGLYNIAVRMLGDEDLASDAVQETLISAWRSLHTFSGGSLKAWLSRTVINKCYDEFRRTKRQRSVPLTPVVDGEEIEEREWLRDPGPSLDAQIETIQLNQALQNCLQTLPVTHRAILVMVDVEGMNYDEAASSLGIPIGTVKSRLARARANMRHSLRNVSQFLPSAFQIQIPASA